MQTRWVFGYGSLIWNPGFEFVSSQLGVLRGAHRSLSVISHHHRGTPDVPGLVFGLARGGSCRGMAFEVSEEAWSDVRAYLDARELVTSVYRDVWRPVSLKDGRRVSALAYVVDQTHEQFAGTLTLEQQLEIIRTGVGISGRNVDYVVNTAAMLDTLGITDKRLTGIVRELRAPECVAA